MIDVCVLMLKDDGLELLVVFDEHLLLAKQRQRVLDLCQAPVQHVFPLQLAGGLQHKRERLHARYTSNCWWWAHTCISACTDTRLRSSAASMSFRSSSPIRRMPVGRLAPCLAACVVGW